MTTFYYGFYDNLETLHHAIGHTNTSESLKSDHYSMKYKACDTSSLDKESGVHF